MYKAVPLFLSLVLLLSLDCIGQDFFDGFVKGRVLAGEGVYSLLRRYEVNTPCDQFEFLINNQMELEDDLQLGKDYILPIIQLDTTVTPLEALTNSSLETLLAYNKKVISRKLKTKDSLLWVPIHFIVCDEEGEQTEVSNSSKAIEKKKQEKDSVLEIVTNKKVKPKKMGPYPIFGLEYSDPEILSKRLKNQVFYIMGGHGGPDPGAVGKADGHYIVEDEYAYDVSLRLARRLIQHSATVYLIVQDKSHGIRDEKYLDFQKNEVHFPNKKIPRKQLTRLKARSEIINGLYDENLKKGVDKQYMVSIHIDGRSKNTRIDMFFYHDPISKKGKKLSNYFKNFMANKYEEFQKGRGYKGTAKPRNLYVLKNTKPIGLFVEIGNLHNAQDRKRILNPDNREAVAKWMSQCYLSLHQ